MKKWCIIEQSKSDGFITEYDSKKEAITDAVNIWDRLTKNERKNTSISVALLNVDEDGYGYESDDDEFVWDSEDEKAIIKEILEKRIIFEEELYNGNIKEESVSNFRNSALTENGINRFYSDQNDNDIFATDEYLEENNLDWYDNDIYQKLIDSRE